MAITKRTLWAGTVLSLLAFLPASFWAFMAMAGVGFSGRGEASKVLIVMSAALVPTSCVIGPILTWNNFDRGRWKIATVAMASPILISLLCAFAVTMTH